MIIESKYKEIDIFFEEELTPDLKVGEPGYLYPSMVDIAAINITADMFDNLMYIRKIYPITSTIEPSPIDTQVAYEIKFKGGLFQFYDLRLAKIFFEIFCAKDFDDKTIAKDYPEINL